MIDLSKYNEIIIWGASFPPSEIIGNATSTGRAIEQLSEILKKRCVWDRVIAIVDSNSSLHGKKRLGVNVMDPKIILDHPHALIIINTISFVAVEAAMQQMNAHNDYAIVPHYFYHGTVDHPYVNEVAKEDILRNKGKILKLYDLTDEITKRYLNIIIDMRSSGIDKLYPAEYYSETGKGIEYFCDNDLSPLGNVSYIDVGAYDGNSIEPVIKYYKNRLSRIIAFEPDDNSRSQLRKYVEKNGLTNKTQVFSYALGDENKQIRFSAAGQMGQVDANGDIVLEQRKFDDIKDISVEGIPMVKMDIEGAEMGALRGMEQFIKKFSPYLAICIYHKEHDLYEIAKYLKDINPSYRLFIRGGWHLECWAVPERHFK